MDTNKALYYMERNAIDLIQSKNLQFEMPITVDQIKAMLRESIQGGPEQHSLSANVTPHKLDSSYQKLDSQKTQSASVQKATLNFQNGIQNSDQFRSSSALVREAQSRYAKEYMD